MSSVKKKLRTHTQTKDGNHVATRELELTGELNGHSKAITLVTFYKGKLYTGSQDCTVRQYEPESGLCVGVFKEHQKMISSMVISILDGILFTGDAAGVIMSWAVERQIVLKTFKHHTKAISCLCLASSKQQYVDQLAATKALVTQARYLYSGSFDCDICQWSVDTGQCIRVFSGHTDSITSLALSKNGKTLFSSSTDKTIRKWNTEDGTCLLKLEGHNGWVWDFCIVPNTLTLFSAGMDGKLIKWNIIAGRVMKEIEAHNDSICRLCLTATKSKGKITYSVFSGSWDGTVKKWDADTGELLKTLHGHTGKIKSMQILLDKILITASEDQTVRIWDIKSGQNVFTLNTDKPVTCFCFGVLQGGEAAHTLFIGCKDGTVRRYSLPKNKLTDKMESRRELLLKKLNRAINQKNEEDEDEVIYGFSGAFGNGVSM